jgi:hypothetical protein
MSSGDDHPSESLIPSLKVLRGLYGEAGAPIHRLLRRIVWGSVSHHDPGDGTRVELPEELVPVVRQLVRTMDSTDDAKTALSKVAAGVPADDRPDAATGLIDRFTSRARMDIARAELFALLLHRVALPKDDRELLERALTSLETRMMEYVLPHLSESDLASWDLKAKAHLAEPGTNPKRDVDVSPDVEASATDRSMILERALSDGLTLDEAEHEEEARWG